MQRSLRLPLTVVSSLLILVGCPPTEPAPEPPVQDTRRRTLQGTVSWTTDWTDEYSDQNSYAQDCTKTRTYSGVEDASAPWLCAGCQSYYRLSYDEADDTGDCAEDAAHSLGYPGAAVRLGLMEGYVLFDAREITYLDYTTPEVQTNEGLLLGFDVGAGSVNEERVSVEYVEEGWAWTTQWSFQLERGRDDGDLLRGMEPPETYACGWGRSGAAPYDGDYRAAVGAPLPDGVLLDQCGDPTRVWDLLGSYLIIESGAIGCGPCENSADAAPGLLAELRSEGIEAAFIPALSPVTFDTDQPVGPSEMAAWAEGHELEGPVLLDASRWFDTILARAGFDPFGIPAYLLVGPDGTILYVQGDDGIDLTGLAALIRQDAAR